MGSVGEYWKEAREHSRHVRDGSPEAINGVKHQCGGDVVIYMGEAAPRMRFCAKCDDCWMPEDDAKEMRGRRMRKGPSDG